MSYAPLHTTAVLYLFHCDLRAILILFTQMKNNYCQLDGQYYSVGQRFSTGVHGPLGGAGSCQEVREMAGKIIVLNYLVK